MLHSVIVVSKLSDPAAATVRPLSARSLALSVMLGSHPPEMPARALVDLAELFGIAGGTMRTAISRSVAGGEITARDGSYRLTTRLLDRQRSQDIGRQPPPEPWDRQWHTVVAASDQRELADRRRFRTVMENHRFGELRPDIWLRPANLPMPEVESDWIATTSRPEGIDPERLASRLWNRDAIATTARGLLAEMARCRDDIDWADVRSIPELFLLSATIVRFLRSEPLLPSDLTPDDWPITRLRDTYDRFERDHQLLLQQFLRGN
jgi:phenylacetic acid degradation operon negative regulatory protein